MPDTKDKTDLVDRLIEAGDDLSLEAARRSGLADFANRNLGRHETAQTLRTRRPALPERNRRNHAERFSH